MSNAAELFIETAYEIAPAEFCAELLSATGRAQTYKIYERIFEDGEKGSYAVFTALCDDKSIMFLENLMGSNNGEILKKVFMAFNKTKTPYILRIVFARYITRLMLLMVKYPLPPLIMEGICKMGAEKEARSILILSLHCLEENNELTLLTLLKNYSSLLFYSMDDETIDTLIKFDVNNRLFELDGTPNLIKGYIINRKNDRQSVNSLVSSLKNGDYNTSRKAADILSYIRNNELLQSVVELLKDALKSNTKDYNLIQLAMYALRNIDEIKDKNLIKLLWKFSQDNGLSHIDFYYYSVFISLFRKANTKEYIMKLFEGNNIPIQILVTPIAIELCPQECIKRILNDIEGDLFFFLYQGTFPPSFVSPLNSNELLKFHSIAAFPERYWSEIEDGLLKIYKNAEINIIVLEKIFQNRMDIRNRESRVKYIIEKGKQVFRLNSYLYI